jgi:peptidoglycan/LPS O-acetylase OafA/YrhL
MIDMTLTPERIFMTEVVQPATVPAPGEVPVVDAKRRPTRVIQLDFLRGVAILMVLGNHSFNIIHPEDAGFFRPLARLFDLFGWTGVDLFFVLSGFLVGGLLLRELQKYGKLDVGRFIIRRGLKIWPSYYIFLFWLLFQGYRATHSWHAALHPLIPNFLHIQNYVLMPEYHTWTLSLEEHFYLFLPLLLWLLMRRRERRLLHLIPAVYLTIAIACLVMRFLILIVYQYHPGMDAVSYPFQDGCAHVRGSAGLSYLFSS